MKNKRHRHGARSFLSCYPASLSIHFISMADNNDQSYMLSSLHAKREKICFSQFSFKSEKELFQKPLLKVPHISLADFAYFWTSQWQRGWGSSGSSDPPPMLTSVPQTAGQLPVVEKWNGFLESEPKCPSSQTVTSQNYTFENLCN